MNGRGADDSFNGKVFSQASQVERIRSCAGSPAQGSKVGGQGFRQKSPFTVLPDRRRARAFAQLAPVRGEDHRDVGKNRPGPAHEVDDGELPRRVGQFPDTLQRFLTGPPRRFPDTFSGLPRKICKTFFPVHRIPSLLPAYRTPV